MVEKVLKGAKRIYMDTAPFIYIVEASPEYKGITGRLFQYAEEYSIEIITSSVTLTEVLVKPFREGDEAVVEAYRDFILRNFYVTLALIDSSTAERAATLRAQYNLRTPDALQLASAIENGCEGFITNDKALQRISEITVFVLDDLRPTA